MDPRQQQHHMMEQQPPSQYYQLQDVPPVPPEKGPLPAAQYEQQYQQQQPYEQSYQPYRPPYSHTNPAASTAPSSSEVPIKRSIALIFLAVTALLFLCVIGLSAGLGVSQRNLQQAKSDLSSVEAIVSAAVAEAAAAGDDKTTVYVTPTPTAAAPTTAVQTSPTATPTVDCPKSNGTFVTSATGNKRFQRLCGLDYGGNGEAIDIGSVKTLNMNDCIDACAAKANCTGAGWGILTGDKGLGPQPCWMKMNLTKSHNATSDWGFAILVSKSST
ncbi:hypothetical protein B0H63DRAFT_560655 [Podospora didyma]|uniref:Apple domain-containing protein n=1 Tax=Podospora didyma TaxID=330526 RepID=A0AAE0NG14_9PEZI|nr:hypothetical protein B0H63DRAFT_560655 [Podospora didyma]